MTQFVIRSMSTTDYNPRIGKQSIVPYHIYLKPLAQRAGAYWSQTGAMRFDSFEAALAEKTAYRLTGAQIVPVDYAGPAYWESRADVEG